MSEATFKAFIAEVENPARGPLTMLVKVYAPFTPEDFGVVIDAHMRPVSRPVEITLRIPEAE